MYQLLTKSFVDCTDLFNSKRKPVTHNSFPNIVIDLSGAQSSHHLTVVLKVYH